MDRNSLKTDIKQETLGQVSIKDVARIAGVSIATVSRCINEPERVREKTRSRNTEPEIVPHKLVIRRSVAAPAN